MLADYILYSGKLLREKTFANFTVLWLFAKVFSAKFGGMASLAWHKRAIHESFPRKNRTFHQFMKVFSLESFPLYGKLNLHSWASTLDKNFVPQDIHNREISFASSYFIL